MSVFHGTDYDAPRDRERLSSQQTKVKSAALLFSRHGWWTMAELSEYVDGPPASVERQVRYMRKPEFGGYVVEKRHVAGGTFQYRVLAPGQGSLF